MRKANRSKPYSKIFRHLVPIPEHVEMSLNNLPPTNHLENTNVQSSGQTRPSLILDSLKIPDIVKDLPVFDGNPRCLHEFLTNVEEILGLLVEIDGTNYAKIILRAIRNKIVGPANEILNIYGTPLIWENIKSNLILHYSDKRNETSLIRDLHNLRQTNQTVQEFYSSIIEILSTINNNIMIHETNSSVIEAKQKLFAEMCLNTFLSGLKEPLGSSIRSMRPNTMAEALSFCINEQNMFYVKKQSNYTNFLPRQDNRNFFPTQPYNSRFRNGFIPQVARQTYPMTPFTFSIPGNQNQPRFSPNPQTNRANIFGQNRPSIPFAQRNYSPDGQNIQTSNNPNNLNTQRNRQNILPPPEPMDISSGYTHLRRPTSTQVRRNMTQPQNLHNINFSNPPYTYLDDYYQEDIACIQGNDYSQEPIEPLGHSVEESHFDNEIDDSENFQSRASQDQLDT